MKDLQPVHIAIIIAIIVLFLIAAGIAAFFIFRKVSESASEMATKPVIFYAPPDEEVVSSEPGAMGEPAPERIYDTDGIPNVVPIAGTSGMCVLKYGAAWVRTREILEILRRHLLIPVDISRNAGADPRQTFLMHPKKFASQLGTLVAGADQEFYRNMTLAVLLERSVVQQPTQYVETIRLLFGPIAAACPDLEALFGQVGKVPQQQAKNAEYFNAALKSADRRSRFVVALAVSLLVFTRDNAPVALKVVELVKHLNMDALLACCDVDPPVFATFERAIQVRSPMGRPPPAAGDVAEDAVRRGFGHSLSSCVLSPLQFPVPPRPIPTACLGDLLLAAHQLPHMATIVDNALASYVSSDILKASFLVAAEKHIEALMSGLKATECRTISALKSKQSQLKEAQAALAPEEQQSIDALDRQLGHIASSAEQQRLQQGTVGHDKGTQPETTSDPATTTTNQDDQTSHGQEAPKAQGQEKEL